MDKNQKKKKSSRVEEQINLNKKMSGKKTVNNKKGKIKKEKKKKFSILGFIFSVFLILIILLCGLFAYCFVKEDFDINKAISSLISMIYQKPKSITVLLLGVSTDIDTELSDTIMICSYNPENQKAYIISIPRDTFVGDNKKLAKGKDKINAMYSRKGPKELIKTVENITDLDIDYYVVVKNEALIEMVDSIGGVNFNVPIDMNYDDITQNLHIHLNSGEQLIDGQKAEQLLRFRHNNDGTSYPSSYGDNDFGRMRTQREFIIQTAKQTLKLKNASKLNKIAKSVFENVETNMNMFSAIKYIPSLMNFDSESIETYQLPGESKKLNSLWFFVYNESETLELSNRIKQNLE